MSVELSVIIPCLNEEKTIATCVKRARRALEKNNISGEVVVIDNGSTDQSAQLAKEAGARVIAVASRGYGSALKKGIEEAEGKFIIMGDADNTYDFSEIPKFVRLLRQGAELVMGSRLRGRIYPHAMPASHRWLGTPVLTLFLNVFFHTHISDVNCGLRGFKKEAIQKLNLKCNGMEFASEMITKAAQRKLKILETPISYYPALPDRDSHLSSFRDGWRHLRFMLVFCPKYLFIFPGIILSLSGLLLVLGIFFRTLSFFHMPLGLSAAVVAHAVLFMGIQVISFGVYAIILNSSKGLLTEDKISYFFKKHFTLEKGLLVGGTFCVSGCIMLLVAYWSFLHFAPQAPLNLAGSGVYVNVALTKFSIFSIFIILLGIQIIFSSFYISLFNLTQTLK